MRGGRAELLRHADDCGRGGTVISTENRPKRTRCKPLHQDARGSIRVLEHFEHARRTPDRVQVLGGGFGDVLGFLEDQAEESIAGDDVIDEFGTGAGVDEQGCDVSGEDDDVGETEDGQFGGEVDSGRFSSLPSRPVALTRLMNSVSRPPIQEGYRVAWWMSDRAWAGPGSGSADLDPLGTGGTGVFTGEFNPEEAVQVNGAGAGHIEARGRSTAASKAP
jgi:hypothetical protein